MKKNEYDVVVVGARAAGAATAMLLARRGYRVLAVDRARYGSDTLSTHALMRTAVLQLQRWGLADAIRASGAPPVRRVAFHYPGESIAVDIKPADGVDALYAPRRTVLDRILADAAIAAGATLEFGVAVDELQIESDRVVGIVARDEEGRDRSVRAGLVVGADGIRSVVAHSVNAPVTRRNTTDAAMVYGYFRGVETIGYEWVYGTQVAAGLIPTNDSEVCVFVSGSAQRFRRDVQPDLAHGLRRLLTEASPEAGARVRAGELCGRLRGFAGVGGYYRKPFGPGWALVGDAGYFRDPITTHGISDAFRDAELLVRAIEGLSSFEEYERIRNEVTADLFEVTGRIAGYGWSAGEIREHLRLVSRAMRAEVDLILGFEKELASSCPT